MDIEITSRGEVKYLGHLPDGSGVQAHSAGEHYPYIIAVIERAGADRRYEVNGPGVEGLRYSTDREATLVAKRLAVCIRNEDAWAFEVERAAHLGMVRLQAVVDWVREAASDAGTPEAYSEMTEGQRAQSLIAYGYARGQNPRVQVSAPVVLADLLRFGDERAEEDAWRDYTDKREAV